MAGAGGGAEQNRGSWVMPGLCKVCWEAGTDRWLQGEGAIAVGKAGSGWAAGSIGVARCLEHEPWAALAWLTQAASGLRGTSSAWGLGRSLCLKIKYRDLTFLENYPTLKHQATNSGCTAVICIPPPPPQTEVC